LGGNLDLNGQTVSGTGTINVTGTIQSSAGIYLANSMYFWNRDAANANWRSVLGTDGSDITYVGSDSFSTELRGSVVNTDSKLRLQKTAATAATAALEINAANPMMVFYESDQALDNKLWSIQVSGGQLGGWIYEDAGGNTNRTQWLAVDRTGYATVDSIGLTATSVDVTGDFDVTGTATLVDAQYTGSLQHYNGASRFSYDTVSSVSAASADGWVRIAKCTSASGRGGCRIYVSHTGGSGAPDAMVIEIAASWDGKAAVSKIFGNPGGTGITDIKVGYVSPEQYVNIKVSQASAQTYRIRVVQDLVLSGLWVADGVNPETKVFTDEYEFNVNTNSRYWGIHTADNVLGTAEFYLDTNGLTFESLTGDATLFLKGDTSNTQEAGNPNIVMVQDGTAVETVISMSGLTAQDGRGNTVADAVNNTFLIHARWSDSSNEIGFAVAAQKYAAVTQDGLWVYDHVEPGASTTATQGQTLMKGYYTGTEHLFSVGSEYSSGKSCFMFGVQPKAGASGFTSMTDNNTNHAVLKMGSGGLYYQTKTASVVSIGADATLLTKWHVDDAGQEFVGGDTVGYREAHTGNYGSVAFAGWEGTSGLYGGVSLNGRIVFMHNDNTQSGIYNDVNNEWLAVFTNNSNAQLYFNGIQSLVTNSEGFISMKGSVYMVEKANAGADTAARGQLWVRNDAPCNLMFTDDAGTDSYVGLAEYKTWTNQSFNFNTVGNGEDVVNGLIYYTNTTAYTITLSNSTNTEFPVGGRIDVYNRGTNTITVNEGTSMTLYYLSGSAATDTAGGCTIAAGGYASIIKESTTVWVIMGGGITA
jgi:hypothetical protein